jgi:hypothetical protein
MRPKRWARSGVVILAVTLSILLPRAMPLTAQAPDRPLETVDDRQAEPSGTVVLFTVQGRLPQPRGDVGLPLPLVDRLSEEPALATLDVDGRTGSAANPLVSANFAFQSTAEFRQWYASPRTAALLRDLVATLAEPRRRLRIVRRPLSGYFSE